MAIKCRPCSTNTGSPAYSARTFTPGPVRLMMGARINTASISPSPTRFRKSSTGLQPRHAAIDLTSVPIALDSHIHRAKALLRGIANIRSHQDRPGACAEHRLLRSEAPQWFFELSVIEELQHGGALAAGNHQAIQIRKLFRRANLDGRCTRLFERFLVGFEVALQSQHAHAFFCRHDYQPRVAINSLSGSFKEMSSPGIAIPRSSLRFEQLLGVLVVCRGLYDRLRARDFRIFRS